MDSYLCAASFRKEFGVHGRLHRTRAIRDENVRYTGMDNTIHHYFSFYFTDATRAAKITLPFLSDPIDNLPNIGLGDSPVLQTCKDFAGLVLIKHC
jgi:hypothetical protein